ncbi:hypothetical protein KUL118_04080 [Tenacibaculum sp. KUL118]|nr:hypothetical protein KUL118_04080 [Tenacibaculum sp. KUL118]
MVLVAGCISPFTENTSGPACLDNGGLDNAGLDNDGLDKDGRVNGGLKTRAPDECVLFFDDSGDVETEFRNNDRSGADNPRYRLPKSG